VPAWDHVGEAAVVPASVTSWSAKPSAPPWPAAVVVGLGRDGRNRRRPAVLADRVEHEVRAGDMHDLPGQRVLGLDADADLHARATHVVHRRPGGHKVADVDRRGEAQLVDPGGHDADEGAASPRAPDARLQRRHLS